MIGASSTSFFSAHVVIARAMNSGPLSDRSKTSCYNGSEWSIVTLRVRYQRPSVRLSLMKSSDQQSLGC